MRVLYLDCFAGISGDMTVAALTDLGVPESTFRNAIDQLGLSAECHLHFHRATRCGIEGVKFDVHTPHGHADNAPSAGDSHEHAHTHAHSDSHSHGHSHSHSHSHGHSHSHSHSHSHGGDEDKDKDEDKDEDGVGDHPHVHGRTHRQIKEMIDASSLSEPVKRRALAVFHRIAIAEGKIHGMSPEDVHFHEVGAVDSIADVVCACAGIEALGVDRVLVSSLAEGTGVIDCAHGRFPLPAPATLEILAGIPLSQTNRPEEQITPTGAAIVAEFGAAFGPMPMIAQDKIGYGCGSRNPSDRPNVLRAVLGELTTASDERDEIVELRTNLDDTSPEVIAACVEDLFAAGALDCFLTPIQMKKGRPGTLLTVLTTPSDAEKLANQILRDTTAFGVRMHPCPRLKLRRDYRTVETEYGAITIKTGFIGSEQVQASPEYDSCREAAEKAGVAVRKVIEAALKNA